MVVKPFAEASFEVRGLSKQYVQRGLFDRRGFIVQALQCLDLSIPAGTTLAVVGESGSGKSTLARCLALLETPSAGEIWFEGRNLFTLGKRDLRAVRAQIQLIFQDPVTALNPRLTAVDVVAEPLLVQKRAGKGERRERALELMAQVGLSPQWGNRRPGEFSGGQRQRLAIARALALEPKFLILDEALSALDPPVQAQIVNLLLELQASYGLTYLYITHDLGMLAHLADEVAILRQGKLVERAKTMELLLHPQDSYTRRLLDSAPALVLSAGE
jgi:ABC-type glutathione transport system ATPase component